jgi:hypothetical protein
MPEYINAECAILVTESGRARVFRQGQQRKRKWGIVVNCDGASNVTEIKLEHLSKTESPRVETDEGTVKEVRLLHHENA